MNRNLKPSRIGLVLGFSALPFLGLQMNANAADVTVDVASKKQVIDGFGASSAWSTLSDKVANSLYGDLGYTILRVRIEENIGDDWKTGKFSSWAGELANAKKAVANGAIVFASPWNPPPSLRLNGGGGKYSIDPSKWAGYRDYLNAYVKYMKDNGVDLHAISIQNEPDWAMDWTKWTETQNHDFVLNYGATINTKLMAAESFNFKKDYYDQILNDPKALANVALFGTHLYGSFAGADVKNLAYPLFELKGRPAGVHLWMTEHYFDTDNTSDLVKMMKEIHDCMVTGNMNAYVYWWIAPWGNGLAGSSGDLYKRAYVLGQFAKDIRPGYFRVDATAEPGQSVSASAYAGENKVVIVALNTGTSAVDQKFTVKNATVPQITSWETSANKNGESGSMYPLNDGSFTASLPAQSITTFVGINIAAGIQPRMANLGFKANLSRGNIVVTPITDKPYSISVHSLNGQQVVAKTGTGALSIPVGAKGMYNVKIDFDGHTQQEFVTVF